MFPGVKKTFLRQRGLHLSEEDACQVEEQENQGRTAYSKRGLLQEGSADFQELAIELSQNSLSLKSDLKIEFPLGLQPKFLEDEVLLEFNIDHPQSGVQFEVFPAYWTILWTFQQNSSRVFLHSSPSIASAGGQCYL